MSTQSVDPRQGAPRRVDYSAHSEDTARAAIKRGRVRAIANEDGQVQNAWCESATSSTRWRAVAQYDSEGEVIGITCNCPNGTLGGIQARCWHTCALELINEARRNLSQM